ncbi:MAG: hypothetical protein WD651_10955 [Acidimicrobiia bacterium]
MREPEQDPGSRPAAPPGMPRWVKVSLLVVLVAAVSLVIAMLLAGGDHGPGLHTGSANSMGTISSSNLGGWDA